MGGGAGGWEHGGWEHGGWGWGVGLGAWGWGWGWEVGAWGVGAWGWGRVVGRLVIIYGNLNVTTLCQFHGVE